MASKENGLKGATAKVYFKGEALTVEEDLLHEFKGHRNFCKEEIPHDAIINRTRKPISRNFCGFLNSGKGGIVYCGVTDAGIVGGIGLTNYQKDHVLLTVHDTFSRFDPPVSPDMFNVYFVPVVTEPQEVYDIPSQQSLDKDKERVKPHILRTTRYCWCDKDANAQFNMGMIAQLYVIEIEIFPWNPKSDLGVTQITPIQPLFCNEEGTYLIRRSGCLHQPSLADVIQLAEAETILYHHLK